MAVPKPRCFIWVGYLNLTVLAGTCNSNTCEHTLLKLVWTAMKVSATFTGYDRGKFEMSAFTRFPVKPPF